MDSEKNLSYLFKDQIQNLDLLCQETVTTLPSFVLRIESWDKKLGMQNKLKLRLLRLSFQTREALETRIHNLYRYTESIFKTAHCF